MPSASRSPGRAGTFGRSSPGALVAAVVAAVAEPARPLGRPLAAQGGRRAAGRAGALLAADAGTAARDEPRGRVARAPRRLEAAARALPRRGLLAARPLHRGDPGEPARRARPEGQRALDARPAGARASRPGPGRARTRGSPTSRAGSCASSPATAPATKPSAAPRSSRPRGDRGLAACSPTRRAQDGGLRRRPRTRSPEALERVDEARLVGRRAVSCCRSRRTGRVSTPARRSSQRTTRPRRPPTATPPSRETRSSRHARPATAATSSRSPRQDGLPRHGRLRPARRPLRTAAGCSLTWPTANQWVFVRPAPEEDRRRIADLAAVRALGHNPGWCCEG